MHFHRQSAQVSLALLIASTITFGMLVLTLVLVGQSFRGMENAKATAAADATHQLTVSVNDRIRAIIEPTSVTLTLLSHDPLTRASSLDARLQRLPVIADALRQNDIVSAVYTGYDNGESFLLRKVRSSGILHFPDAPQQAWFLLQTMTLDDTGTRIGEWRFYDRNLQLLRQERRPDYNYDPRERGWFKAARTTAATHVSEPYVFYTTRELGLTLSRQAAGAADNINSNGSVSGIDVTVSDLSRQIADLRQTPGSRIAIINREQTVLAYSHPDRLPARTDQEDPLYHLEEIPDSPLPMASGLADSERAERFTLAGEDWYGMTAPLTTLGPEELTIVIAIPADELLAEVWSALARQTGIASLIALVLLAAGWMLGRRVGRPLEQLTDRVSSLSRFRFDTPIRVDSRIREASKLSIALDDMAGTIHSFQNIATTLNRGQDLHTLLGDILDQIIHILGQHRGAIYLFNRGNGELGLATTHNLEGPKTIPDIRPDSDDSDIIRSLRGPFSGHPVFAILRNRKKQLVGTLIVEMEDGDLSNISDDLAVFVDEIAGSAAVAIETRELIESQQALLEGIIRLVANAIDAKSPYTSGHCERVPKLAQMLVAEATQARDGVFRDFQLSETETYEFHLAAWLHDCGKITSPEYVVDKATKLETLCNRIHEVRTRFEVLHRDAEIRYLQDCLAGGDQAGARTRRDQEQRQLQEDFAFIAAANIGGESMDDDAVARVHQISSRTWQRHFSNRLGLSAEERRAFAAAPEARLPVTEPLLADRPEHIEHWGERVPPVTRDDPRNRWGFDMDLPEHAYNRGEIHNLTIRRGTLTPEERFKINEHIVQTICMLDALPLPDWLSNVPRLAGTHHERMDGRGYPCRLSGDQMGIPERIMAVADVFEALTAVDRPYKEGKTLTEALGIMATMVREHHLDGDVFNLFIRSGVYREYAREHMKPEQIDEVDEARFLS
ncbi:MULTISPECIES: HD domain-containing phosphohydrolase [Marinobacter]|uniref:Phosphodiesterase n=1 Tax=Marinobacter profundi TaxID=2666256 RepID=A0A2G1UGI0_9GAMM|nr:MULTISPECIES: HD domain-containing phosphohydrolase [Marinobacter]MBD3655911.1 HAMP domain-containing protein [Marinobacter sp.]PHQ13598.1 phosphodiesterase [Marinobacter profundi]